MKLMAMKINVMKMDLLYYHDRFDLLDGGFGILLLSISLSMSDSDIDLEFLSLCTSSIFLSRFSFSGIIGNVDFTGCTRHAWALIIRLPCRKNTNSSSWPTTCTGLFHCSSVSRLWYIFSAISYSSRVCRLFLFNAILIFFWCLCFHKDFSCRV